MPPHSELDLDDPVTIDLLRLQSMVNELDSLLFSMRWMHERISRDYNDITEQYRKSLEEVESVQLKEELERSSKRDDASSVKTVRTGVSEKDDASSIKTIGTQGSTKPSRPSEDWSPVSAKGEREKAAGRKARRQKFMSSVLN